MLYTSSVTSTLRRVARPAHDRESQTNFDRCLLHSQGRTRATPSADASILLARLVRLLQDQQQRCGSGRTTRQPHGLGQYLESTTGGDRPRGYKKSCEPRHRHTMPAVLEPMLQTWRRRGEAGRLLSIPTSACCRSWHYCGLLGPARHHRTTSCISGSCYLHLCCSSSHCTPRCHLTSC